MRPQGIIRVALREAAVKLAEQQGGATWRELASSAEVHVRGNGVAGEKVQRGVAPGVARDTVKNMVRCGELAEVGRTKPKGSTQYEAIYAPADPRYGVLPTDDAAAPLVDVVRCWHGEGAQRGA